VEKNKRKKGDKKLEEKIFKANLKLIIPIAKKYKNNPSLTFLELLLEGEKGLKKAIEAFKWRWKNGDKFSSYAHWWIQQAIVNAIVYGPDTGKLKTLTSKSRKDE
jgi:DNA-directed RNA polymerase sigma subunit (sigma70/sigma32)